jgi:hypothetical protein
VRVASHFEIALDGASAGFSFEGMYFTFSNTLLWRAKLNMACMTLCMDADLDPCLSQHATKAWLSTRASRREFEIRGLTDFRHGGVLLDMEECFCFQDVDRGSLQLLFPIISKCVNLPLNGHWHPI